MAVTALTRAPGAAVRPRRVSILGSTGSVGRSTVDLLLRNRDEFTVEAVTANRNAASLAEQARELGARFAAVADPAEYAALKAALSGSGIETGCGPEALTPALGSHRLGCGYRRGGARCEGFQQTLVVRGELGPVV